MKKDIIIPIILIGGIIWMSSQSPKVTPANKRQRLMQFIQAGEDSADTKQRVIGIFQTMSDAEINAVYSFIFDYVQKGRKVPPGSALRQQIDAISVKYNIFT